MTYTVDKAKHPQDDAYDYAISKDTKVELEVFGRVGAGPEGLRDALGMATRVADFLNLEWKPYDCEDKTTYPTKTGLYRVMVAGDSEQCDGHTVYEYDDYETFAHVFNDEDDDDKPYLCFGQGQHDEESDTFIAYYGPIVIPEYKG